MLLLQNICHQGTQISQKQYIQIENFYQQECNKNFQRETLLLLGKIFFCVGWHDKKHASYTSKYRRLVKNDNIYRQTKSRTPCQDQWDYNLHMGGVDLSDMRTYIFLDERRTIRWNKKVFFTLFGRLLLNSFILYQDNGDLPKLDRTNV